MPGMGHTHQNKVCLSCGNDFIPTGQNTKRCPPCRRQYNLQRNRERWHNTYQKKGRNQRGENNNNWKGGVAPSSYQRICFDAHGKHCRCGNLAVLVHHLNEDRSDNRPENLQPMCKRCHQVGHDCAANLPSVVVFKPRKCTKCAHVYQPTGPRGSTCGPCKAGSK